MPTKSKKASELVLAEATKREISRSLAPIDAWAAVDNPEVYLESRLPKYVSILEGLLNLALSEGDVDRARGITNELIRYTKMGRAKADISIAGPSKLRTENDLSKLSTEALKAALGMTEDSQ